MAYIINIGGGSGDGITAAQAAELLATKQDVLVSGVNIKTVNNESLLVSGNDTDVTIQVQSSESETR